ncbi:acyltransferase [Pseudoclavibacter endophyticus]|uniref:Acyltransferase n=1 Tax=Pseudoclavibacter endophyticus TaxID=1778590 RepID=A0A6H9WDS8_9MICO|nr:acyltransferase family protein [Pseudoclavibacter endophyticus]KAB1649102.1 acyltransferase [Pseudoclavibacter endophyticus]GGA65408.1 acyltransferase [Pseudoclavibacter endophyticus]
MTLPATVSAAPSTGAGGPRGDWIPEVQGLRTLALLLVATFHIWFDRVSGGVDIFLLVSAFLMTRSLVGRLERGEPLRPITYIVQRFGRLMPLAIGIGAVTLAASAILLPPSRLREYIEQFLASSLYFENVWLQDALVNYFADDGTLASPFQHYWSLSIQGQIFVIWPLLFVVIWLLTKFARVPLRPLALTLFGALFVAGLAWSTILTAQNQQFAYFDLSARVWEFAAGSILALVVPWLRLGPLSRSIMTWAGIAGAVLGGIVIPVEGTFPGIAALWPVVSAALVIAGAGAPTRFGGDRLLAHPVMTRIGEYTYALYLVHWPVLIIGMGVLRTPRPDVLQGTFLLALSAVLSVAAVHLIEKPFGWFTRSRAPRNGRWPRTAPWRAAVVIVTLPALAAATAAHANTLVDERQVLAWEQLSEFDLATMGPNAAGGENPHPGVVLPNPWINSHDIGGMTPCTESMLPAGVSDAAITHCQANHTSFDPEDTNHSVYLVGNSHVQQLTQFVGQAAILHQWALRGYLMFGCQYGAYGDVAEEECLGMWDDATIDILENKPDAVFVLGTQSTGPDTEDELPGLYDWVETITAAGVDVVVVRDNPRSDVNMPECGDRWGYESDRCTWPTALVQPNDGLRTAVENAGGIYLDINHLICPEGRCRAVYGGIVVFFDNSHVSATYMRALAFTTAPMLAQRLPWWPPALK